MVRALAAAACVIVVVACASPVAPPEGSPSSSSANGDTPAATLDRHLDQLFVEHTMTLAKLTLAAAAGRQDEFHAYAGVLAANGSDVAALFTSAIGVTAGDKVGASWNDGNNFAVDYIVASATQDSAGAQAARQKLSNDYVSEMSSALASVSPAPGSSSQAVSAEVVAFTTLVDDTVAGSYAKTFTDLPAAVAGSTGFADVVASEIAKAFPDRFPGTVDSAPAHRAAGLAAQAAYYSMLTQAVVAKSGAEQAGASQALTANTQALPTSTDLWSQETPLLIAYATNGDAPTRQNVMDRAAGPPDLTTAFGALLQVIDDQRASAYGSLGADDRAAALAFAAAA
jgi:hypothetical protein